MKILVSHTLTTFAVILEKNGHEVIFENAIGNTQPDLIILDHKLYDQLPKIRSELENAAVPVIIAYTQSSDDIFDKGTEFGVDDYLLISSNVNHLQTKINSLKRYVDHSRQHVDISHSDPLTGLMMRQQFINELDEQILAARANETFLGLIIIDVNDFKKINNELGEEIGDLLLKEIALRLSAVLRSNDIIGRINGDEFAVILPDLTSTEDVGPITEKVVNALIADYSLIGHSVSIDISIGLTSYPATGVTPENVFNKTEQGMRVYKSIKNVNFN